LQFSKFSDGLFCKNKAKAREHKGSICHDLAFISSSLGRVAAAGGDPIWSLNRMYRSTMGRDMPMSFAI
jgi:hypothetical protein